MSSLAGQSATGRRPRDPDDRGYFGRYGGRYVPETLVAPVEALEEEYLRARSDPAFGLQYVAIAGQDPHRLGIGDDPPRLEIAQIFVGSPVLGQLDRGSH